MVLSKVGRGELPAAQAAVLLGRSLRQAGRVLLERYQGQFINAVSGAEGSAARLAELVVHDFPSFNDVAEYRGEQVRFYKRAQLLASDLWGAFGGKTWARSRTCLLSQASLRPDRQAWRP